MILQTWVNLKNYKCNLGCCLVRGEGKARKEVNNFCTIHAMHSLKTSGGQYLWTWTLEIQIPLNLDLRILHVQIVMVGPGSPPFLFSLNINCCGVCCWRGGIVMLLQLEGESPNKIGFFFFFFFPLRWHLSAACTFKSEWMERFFRLNRNKLRSSDSSLHL